MDLHPPADCSEASGQRADNDAAQFCRIFGDAAGTLRVIRAPGRVNLIGEHTDYNDGFVFPMAIEPEIRLICRGRDDGVIRLATTIYPDEIVAFTTREPVTKGEPAWTNYIRGMAAQLQRADVPIGGMDALVSNTLPPGGGLSSSAVLEVAAGFALLALAGREMDRQQLALMAQNAEHEFAGVPVGIMDMTAIACGRANHAMLLDCRDLSKKYAPIDATHVRVVIVNSMVKHELSGGEYAERRRQCEQGVAVLQKGRPDVKALRDATLEEVEAAREYLPDVVYRRCRHVVSENMRTPKAAELLGQGQYENVGELMLASHKSLRDDYEVSVPELDYLVEESMKIPGVYGARMTGGGFGGCIVALVKPDAVYALEAHLRSVYPAKFGVAPGVFATNATEGVSLVV